MKKIEKIKNKRRIVPVSLTEDLTRAMLLHSRGIKGCPRPRIGSISWYVWVAVIERLQRDGCEMSKIDEIYKLKT